MKLRRTALTSSFRLHPSSFLLPRPLAAGGSDLTPRGHVKQQTAIDRTDEERAKEKSHDEQACPLRVSRFNFRPADFFRRRARAGARRAEGRGRRAVLFALHHAAELR